MLNEDMERRAVLADRLVKIIEARADDIAMNWYREVKDSHYLPSFRRISEEEALRMAHNVYRRLSYWLIPSHDHEVKEAYEKFGASMFHRGFMIEEVVMVLILIKRYLWLHLLEEGVMTTNLEIYQALDINNKVVLYFDRAIYFGLVGYREAREKDRAAVGP
jgi:hypothetical protein